MTKDEIKKALECCAGYTDWLDCNSCPYFTHHCDRGNRMMQDALDLITEQEKENDLLKMQLQDAVNHGNTFLEEANKFEAENKKLKQRIDIQCDAWQKLSDCNKRLVTKSNENLQSIKVLREENELLREESEKLKADNEILLTNLDTAQDQILQEYHEQQIKQAKIDVLTELKKFTSWAFGSEFLPARYIDEMIEELKQ